MHRPTVALIALAGLALAPPNPALAKPAARPAPVAGGMSSRLAPLKASLARGKQALKQDLTSTLDRSRQEAHEMIDRIIDEGDLASFLDAMEKEEGESSELVAALRAADPEQARNVLHSKLERKLASVGREIATQVEAVDETRLKASLDLALDDLAREESNLILSLDETGDAAATPAAPGSADIDDPEKGPDGATSVNKLDAGAPAAPRASHDGRGRRGNRGGNHGGFRGGHPGGGRPGGRRIRQQARVIRGQDHVIEGQQQVIRHQNRMIRNQNRREQNRRIARHQNRVIRNQARVIHRQNQLAMQDQMLRHQRRQIRHQAIRNQHHMVRQQQMQWARQNLIAQQQAAIQAQRMAARAQRQARRNAWYRQQHRAAAWNNRMSRFERYVYANGARMNRCDFPAGMYYRPDRVERVVRRGLWGVATVAATPFALLASLF